ncbi:9757_t:CDS:1, partial [Ambispora leptoticha]
MSWKNACKKNSQSLKFLSYEPHSEKFKKDDRNSTSIFDEIIGTVQRQDSSSISEIITPFRQAENSVFSPLSNDKQQSPVTTTSFQLSSEDEHTLNILSDHSSLTSSISLPAPLDIAKLMGRYDIWSTQENSDNESIQSKEEQNTDVKTNVIHEQLSSAVATSSW